MLSFVDDLWEKLPRFEKSAAAVDTLHYDGKLKDANFAFVSKFALSYEVLQADFALIEAFAHSSKKKSQWRAHPLLHLIIIQAIKNKSLMICEH